MTLNLRWSTVWLLYHPFLGWPMERSLTNSLEHKITTRSQNLFKNWLILASSSLMKLCSVSSSLYHIILVDPVCMYVHAMILVSNTPQYFSFCNIKPPHYSWIFCWEKIFATLSMVKFLRPELPLNISVMLGWSVAAKFIVQQNFSAIQYNCGKNMLKVAQIF